MTVTQVQTAERETGGSIVIPADRSVSSVGCLRSLGSRDVHTIAVSHTETVPAFFSKYCDEHLIVPSPHENLLSYKDAYLSIASRPDVHTIIPTGEEDAFILAKYRDEFEKHVTVGWPSFESLRVAQDGLRLAQVAEELDIPVPKTRLLDDVTDWSEKLIVKQRHAVLTGDYVDFLSQEECPGRGSDPIYVEPHSDPDRDAIVDTMFGEVPVVQECFRGTEYSFRALYDNGEAVATSLRRQLRGKTYAGGASVFREMTHDPEIERLALKLLDHLEWHGLASVQFIKDEVSGEFKLMEINPRIWASILLDVKSGADFPYHYWLMLNDQSEEIDPSYEVGVATHLGLGELQYLYSVLRDDFPNVERPPFYRALWDVASSVYRHPHFDYLSADDPLPFLYGVFETLSGSDLPRLAMRARQSR